MTDTDTDTDPNTPNPIPGQDEPGFPDQPPTGDPELKQDDGQRPEVDREAPERIEQPPTD